MTTKTPSHHARMLEDFAPAASFFRVDVAESPAAVVEPVAAPLAEPSVSKQTFAELVGMSVRWVEQRIREGMPCEYIDDRPRLRVTPAEDWLRERGHITAERTKGRPGAAA